jgi:hypothetical protein
MAGEVNKAQCTTEIQHLDFSLRMFQSLMETAQAAKDRGDPNTAGYYGEAEKYSEFVKRDWKAVGECLDEEAKKAKERQK